MIFSKLVFAENILMHLLHAGDTLVCHEVQDNKKQVIFKASIYLQDPWAWIVYWVGLFIMNSCNCIISLLVSVILNHVFIKWHLLSVI